MQELFTAQAEPAIKRRERASHTLSNAALAEQRLLELEAYRRGEPCDEAYGLELFRRATVERDPEASEWRQRCFGQIVPGWLRPRPTRATACRLATEQDYVPLTL